MVYCVHTWGGGGWRGQDLLHQQREPLTGDWEELNKRMFTKQLPRCASVRKFKLMKLLTFILTQKYSPSEKQPTHFFTELKVSEL